MIPTFLLPATLLLLTHLPETTSKTSLGCYPPANANQTYIQGSYTSFSGNNYLFQNNTWTEPTPCDTTLPATCFPAALLSSAEFLVGGQIGFNGSNYVMGDFGEWIGLGECIPKPVNVTAAELASAGFGGISRRAVVKDYETCLVGDVCSGAASGFVCCVAPADVKAGKSTCRPASDCAVVSETVPNWSTCSLLNGDVCETGFTCCVAPADVATGKSTCRLPNYCSNTAETIPDYETCSSSAGDVCSTSAFVCCIAPADALSGKTTCRPSTDCWTKNVVADYLTCQTGDICSSNANGFTCCTAPADVSTGKTTCRPSTDCEASSSSTIIADYVTCRTGNVCASAGRGFVCCTAPADAPSGKMTCRPSTDCSSSKTPVADWTTCYTGDVCSSAAKGYVCCVAPADVMSGKSTCRPSNDCASAKTTSTVSAAKTTTTSKSASTLLVPQTKTTTKTTTKIFTTTTTTNGPTPTMFAGVNCYFIYSLQPTTQETILLALSSIKVQTVRIFITSFWQGGKGTDAVGSSDLELGTVGTYNDGVLQQIDALMPLLVKYGIKLQVTMHDRWNLDNTWGICDAYCQTFCSGGSNLQGFYNNPVAAAAFDARISHILNHKNTKMGNRAWKDIPEAIHSFEIQNEGQGSSNGVNQFTNPDWWCSRAATVRQLLGQGNPILVSTGGGQDFFHSLIDQNFACKDIDIVAMHSYNNDINDVTYNLNLAAQLAQLNGKKVFFEEFGATSNKGSWIAQVATVANKLQIPWMPWQVSSVSINNDYEFWTDDYGAWTQFGQYAQAALAY
ncbi:hypothetical protein BCR33DRAFT_699688 [Rhizoclosmatium globosum]|uniref:Uncharacterized protein n=1 Tax=Rhizoclosmatium globosum TaxID=329046 RepID=A0A1Y2BYT6_9FUNG|nr:hypothetical protein BCR33DRAFT_699688 [Rhizoclosmatium globosum]|eukprot:ORY39939.1 hypothetical protein BCR33DRAFT_699688 [Rhizoclosmatium globosum]